jgi:two-component system KDP operon response regulator KdpE
MNPKRILVIDDEAAIRRLLKVSLEGDGYRILEAQSGGEGIQLAANQRPDLILLDLTLPDCDGLTVLNRLREWSQTPVIVLTVRDREHDKIALLDAGADDYVTKPFSPPELLARIRAALRHPAGESPSSVTTGPLHIDMAAREIRVHGKEQHLTATEYELLRLLALNIGKVVTQQHLLSQVWGPHAVQQTHYLRVHVGQLRKKIEDDPSRPRLLMTEPGVGYRLRQEEDWPQPGSRKRI